MKSILDKSFRYVNSANTDIAARFKAIRAAEKLAFAGMKKDALNVTPIVKTERSK